MPNIHLLLHSPCKLPQSQPFQIPLQRSQIREICEIRVPLHINKIVIEKLSQPNSFRIISPIHQVMLLANSRKNNIRRYTHSCYCRDFVSAIRI